MQQQSIFQKIIRSRMEKHRLDLRTARRWNEWLGQDWHRTMKFTNFWQRKRFQVVGISTFSPFFCAAKMDFTILIAFWACAPRLMLRVGKFRPQNIFHRLNIFLHSKHVLTPLGKFSHFYQALFCLLVTGKRR